MGNLGFISMVPQRNVYIVEFLGKFAREMQPGLNFTIPVLERVSHKFSLKETDYFIKQQEAVTKDNVHIFIDGVLYLKIVDPKKAAYGAYDPIHYSDILAQSIMRAEIGKLTLDRTFEEKEYLNEKILVQISVAVEALGDECIRYEIKDIYTENSFKEILNAQAESERVKRATIRDAEGQKQAAINRAEGEKSKLIMEAESKAREIFLSYEAMANRLKLISQSIDSGDVERKALKLSLSTDVYRSLQQLAQPDVNIIIKKNLSEPEAELNKAFRELQSIDGSAAKLS